MGCPGCSFGAQGSGLQAEAYKSRVEFSRAFDSGFRVKA